MSWWQYIKASVGINEVSYDTISDLEKILLYADFGVDLTNKILISLKETLKLYPQHDLSSIKLALCDILNGFIDLDKKPLQAGDFITLWGINGVGKTTCAAKLAYFLKTQGNSVLLAACDTFRAAACEQLVIWADRIGVDIIRHGENADPASVAFDAIVSQKKHLIDFCIADTAGRIHHNLPLQQQSQKIVRVLQKQDSNAPQHRWLVLDAHLGQNSLDQAQHFNDAVQLTGLIITKLDGSAKGGAIAKIVDQLNLPIYFVGTGENINDLSLFRVSEYVDRLFS